MANPTGQRDYPNLSGLNLPQALVKAITKVYSLIYDLRDALIGDAVRSEAFNSVSQTLSNGSVANKLTFDTNVYTSDPIHKPGSGDFIATTAGLYYALGQVSWPGDASGTFRAVSVHLNGNLLFNSAGAPSTTVSPSANGLEYQVAAVLFLKQGDAVSFVAFHDATGSLNTRANHCFGSLTLLNRTAS
jgi:hypothetical protein